MLIVTRLTGHKLYQRCVIGGRKVMGGDSVAWLNNRLSGTSPVWASSALLSDNVIIDILLMQCPDAHWQAWPPASTSQQHCVVEGCTSWQGLDCLFCTVL